MNPFIHIPDVCERDIDLMLLEEFVASTEFRSWFLTNVGAQGSTELLDVRCWVTTENGESDLEITFGPEGNAVKVLIENKVDAPFQPEQMGRYVDRAKGYKDSRAYRSVYIVLMAPSVYMGEDPDDLGLDATITTLTYEDLLQWFSADAHKGPRTDYKIVLLKAAIERGKAGWRLIPHEGMQRFWQSYWELCNSIAPQLSMPLPKREIPAGSHFIVFRPPALPDSVKLKHKAGYGHVDLELRGMGHRLAEVDRLYGAALPVGTQIERAFKSAVIRARVPVVDMAREDFAASEPRIRAAIETAARLLDWYKERARG
jgi:hypothetical protein